MTLPVRGETVPAFLKGIHSMDDMTIKTPNGHMMIRLNQFFPATIKDLNKLIKIISLDRENSLNLLQQLKIFIPAKMDALHEKNKYNARTYMECRQIRIDLESEISSGKYTNGVTIPKEELETKKKDVKQYKKLEKDALNSFEKCKKDIAKLKKNLEVLENYD